MNLSSSLNLPPALALLFSGINQGNATSTQEQLNLLFQSLYKEAQKQVLYDLFIGNTPLLSKLDLGAKQDLVSNSPGSLGSVDNAKSTLEDERETGQNLHLKKPVFTISRQNKSAKSPSTEPSEDKDLATINYCRKEKSLGELSKRFLTMFGRIDDCVICLDVVTKELDVERRRVYDIINILESLGVMYRKGKNNYQWSGLKSIRKTIEKLELKTDIKQEAHESHNDESPSDEYLLDQRLAGKKEKSLAYLAGSFIKLFFSWKEIIPLEEAAWKLSHKDTEEHKIKTKIRRLYDIANVFSSLGLIKKVCLDSKKPAFKWVGKSGLDEFIRKLNNAASKPATPGQKAIDKKLSKTIVKKEEPEDPSLLNFGFSENSNSIQASEDRSTKQFDGFMSVLLGLCKKEAQTNKPSQPSIPSNFLHHTTFGPINSIQKTFGLPPRRASFEEPQTMPDVDVPLTKHTSVDIQTTSDRKKPGTIEMLKIKENCSSINIKRMLPQSMGDFEIRTVKKIKPIAQTSHEKTIVKSIKFSSKENFSFKANSFETKVEN